MTNLPLACELSTAQLAHRRGTVLQRLLKQVKERRVTSRGLHLRFAPSKGIIAELGSFIEDERLCCRFLDFRLDVKRASGPVWLRLSGPRGTKRFLDGLLDTDAPAGAA